MKKMLVCLLCLLLLLLHTSCGQSSVVPENEAPAEEPSQRTDPTPEPPSAVEDSRLFSLEKYFQILPGQSYQEVQGILGNPGEIMVDNERLQSFQWTNEDGSMISVNFYDDEMVSKAQAQLGPLLEGDQRVTQNQFDNLQEGMTLEEVTSVLGPGTERVYSLNDGIEERIIGWENSDGGEISVTLLNNRVTRLSDLMLK